MKPREMMPIEHDQAQMWQLSADRRSVRMELPGLPIEGLPQPIKVKINFDAGVVDQMIERLMVLRAQMLPTPPKPAQRN
jgi:hypothetical protein